MKKFLSRLIPKPRLPKVPTPSLPKFPTPNFVVPGWDLGKELVGFVGKTLDSGVGLVTGTFANIPFFGTTQTDEYDHREFDEKHYFLIPTPGTDPGFAVHIIRSLPKGVPPINELPKQRLVHLPSEHALPMMKELLVRGAQDDVRNLENSNFLTDNLDKFIDEIDKVDSKLFSGSLLLGGMVALVNPLAGSAIALKAMMPSVGLILSKYGLKFANETMTNMEASKRIKNAEKEVLAQFKKGQTIQLINPLLAHLADVEDADEFLCDSYDIPKADYQRLIELTEQAAVNVRGQL